MIQLHTTQLPVSYDLLVDSVVEAFEIQYLIKYITYLLRGNYQRK